MKTIAINQQKDFSITFLIITQHLEQVQMSILKQTQLKTAVSELLTNALKYAGAASVTIELTGIMERRGIRVTVTDNGPGIKDIPLALTPGYSTKGTLGLGLPGAQRLVDQFTIESAPNAGTMVKVTKWA